MKKHTLATLLVGSFLFTACSTTIKSSSPQKLSDLKHICIKESTSPKLPEFTQLIAENLKQRGITSSIQTELASDCRYALGYSLKNKGHLISVAKLRLSSIVNGSRDNIGEVSYWLKGKEEKAKVLETGLKGQVKTIVDELLKNN